MCNQRDRGSVERSIIETGICLTLPLPPVTVTLCQPHASLLYLCGRIHGHYRDVRFSKLAERSRNALCIKRVSRIRTYVPKSTNPQTLMSLYPLQMPCLFSRKQSRLTWLAKPGCDNIRSYRKSRKFRNKPRLFHSCPGLDVLSDKTRIPVQDNEEPSQPRLYVTYHAPNVLICTPVGPIILDNAFNDMSKGKIRKCLRVGTS